MPQPTCAENHGRYRVLVAPPNHRAWLEKCDRRIKPAVVTVLEQLQERRLGTSALCREWHHDQRTYERPPRGELVWICCRHLPEDALFARPWVTEM